MHISHGLRLKRALNGTMCLFALRAVGGLRHVVCDSWRDRRVRLWGLRHGVLTLSKKKKRLASLLGDVSAMESCVAPNSVDSCQLLFTVQWKPSCGSHSTSTGPTKSTAPPRGAPPTRAVAMGYRCSSCATHCSSQTPSSRAFSVLLRPPRLPSASVCHFISHL